MPTSDAFALRQSGFNEFLFAPIGMEANGMTLSLLSLFARAGNDPWLEAGRLAGLPISEATEILARKIASMPSSVWPLQAATAIATRLIALLPTGPTRIVQSLSVPVVGSKAGRWVGIAFILLCVACMLAFEAGIVTTSGPPAPEGSAPASVTTAPQLPFGVSNSPSTAAPARSPVQ